MWISTLGPEALPEDVTLALGQIAPDLTSVAGETESESSVNEKIPTAERRNNYYFSFPVLSIKYFPHFEFAVIFLLVINSLKDFVHFL